VNAHGSTHSAGIPGWVFVAITLLGTVYGQLVLKWQIAKVAGDVPSAISEKVGFLLKLMLLNPWVFSAFAAAGIAAVAWMAALSVYDLSVAYPFMSLSFVLVAMGSAIWLGEAFTVGKLVALAFIAVGLIIGSRL